MIFRQTTRCTFVFFTPSTRSPTMREEGASPPPLGCRIGAAEVVAYAGDCGSGHEGYECEGEQDGVAPSGTLALRQASRCATASLTSSSPSPWAREEGQTPPPSGCGRGATEEEACARACGARHEGDGCGGEQGGEHGGIGIENERGVGDTGERRSILLSSHIGPTGITFVL